jgi:L-alanine-DL-glutamate epimerase-like enolase superfamily enzyme
MGARSLSYERIENPLRWPLRVSGYVFESMPAVIVSIAEERLLGRAEAAGVYYLGDDTSHIAAEIERVRDTIEQGADRAQLQSLLPAGGARNAIDCALWELESRRSGTPIWRLAGAERPRPLTTTFTLPADDPAQILAKLQAFPPLKALKLKLDGDLDADIERVRTVRRIHPRTWLGVDANQGYGRADLEHLIDALVQAKVALLEQPNRRGDEAMLDGLDCPIPIAADESILDGEELETHFRRYEVINIKLDKCGGLTEALRMKDLALKMGKTLMVGNMGGGSLAAAPAFILGQFCEIADLDGPWYLADDQLASKLYDEGRIMLPADLWGVG